MSLSHILFSVSVSPSPSLSLLLLPLSLKSSEKMFLGEDKKKNNAELNIRTTSQILLDTLFFNIRNTSSLTGYSQKLVVLKDQQSDLL